MKGGRPNRRPPFLLGTATVRERIDAKKSEKNVLPRPLKSHSRLLHHVFLLRIAPSRPARRHRPRPQCAGHPATGASSQTSPARARGTQTDAVRDGRGSTQDHPSGHPWGLPSQRLEFACRTCANESCPHRGRCRRWRDAGICNERFQELRQPCSESPCCRYQWPPTLGEARKHPVSSISGRDRGSSPIRSGKTGRPDGLLLPARTDLERLSAP
jgi:hypothetical protein